MTTATATASPDSTKTPQNADGQTLTLPVEGMHCASCVGRVERAIAKLESALRAFEIVGVSTNVEFLKRVCQADAFVAGDVETGFIDKWRDVLFKPRHINDEVFAQAALGVLNLQLLQPVGAAAPHGQTLGFGAPLQVCVATEPRLVHREDVDLRLAPQGPLIDECAVARVLRPEGRASGT